MFGSHHHKKTKKEKKKAQLEKNKRDNLIFQLSALNRENVERDGGLGAPEIEKTRNPEKPKTEEDKQQAMWSSKVQEIRNLNNNHRRAATDRWNRFAGTSDGGGRGR